jgi:hypothetical protein
MWMGSTLLSHHPTLLRCTTSRSLRSSTPAPAAQPDRLFGTHAYAWQRIDAEQSDITRIVASWHTSRARHGISSREKQCIQHRQSKLELVLPLRQPDSRRNPRLPPALAQVRRCGRPLRHNGRCGLQPDDGHGKHTSLPAKVDIGQTQDAKKRRRRESHNLVECRCRDNINERIYDFFKPLLRLPARFIRRVPARRRRHMSAAHTEATGPSQ